MRLDERMVMEGLAVSVKEAGAMCMANKVLVANVPVSSGAVRVAPTAAVRLRGQKEHPWVSRGGLKLAHALEEFGGEGGLDVRGKVAIDVGCSTGGFTQVLLEGGVAKVYAVDVGYGQLALPLRNDDRVVVMERTNARGLTREGVPDPVSLVVCDASFIPLSKVLPAALSLCGEGGALVALVKPQFEAEREEVESGTGVVRDPAVRERTVRQFQAWLREEGWEPRGETTSPITGPAGNVEFVVYAVKGGVGGAGEGAGGGREGVGGGGDAGVE